MDKGLYEPRLELGTSWCPRLLQHWQFLKGTCCSPVLREKSVTLVSLESHRPSGTLGEHRGHSRAETRTAMKVLVLSRAEMVPPATLGVGMGTGQAL